MVRFNNVFAICVCIFAMVAGIAFMAIILDMVSKDSLALSQAEKVIAMCEHAARAANEGDVEEAQESLAQASVEKVNVAHYNRTRAACEAAAKAVKAAEEKPCHYYEGNTLVVEVGCK